MNRDAGFTLVELLVAAAVAAVVSMVAFQLMVSSQQITDLNEMQQAVIRASRCDLAVRRRLVADYLQEITFGISLMGTSTFSETPTAATGGTPYQAVEIKLVAERTFRGKSQRFPREGVMTFVAASKVIR